MRARELALVAVVLVSLVVSSIGVVAVGTGSVAATSQPTTNATAEEPAADEETTVVAQVDDRVRITSYQYDERNATMSVTLQHTDPSGERAYATLTEAVEAKEDGSTGSFGIAQVRIDPGETITAELSASRNSDGAAIVLVATQRSVNQGRGAFVSDVERPSLGLFEGAATWDLVRLGTIGGTLGVILVAILGAWHLVADSRDRAEVEI